MPRAELIRRLEEGAARHAAEAAERESLAHDECGPTRATMSRTVATIFQNFADDLRRGA